MNMVRSTAMAISVEKQGPSAIAKASFPLRYGTYSEITTLAYEFVFNLNGEIKFIRGLDGNWPHPAEQLKRTDGNDWVYYSVGDHSGDKGIVYWLGEYYLPCLPYQSNPVWEIDYMTNPGIMSAFGAWSQLFADLYGGAAQGRHAKVGDLVNRILQNDEKTLHERVQQLIGILGDRISVLPPDTRHADYETIPLMIADGCLYHCKFCCVKSTHGFRERSREDICRQIDRLKRHYGRNIENYNALFLGNHDALEAGADLIGFAATEAFESFRFGARRAARPFLFLFGSVASLLASDHEAFEKLNQLPFYTYINIGFESVHKPTLSLIGKPLEVSQVREAFQKMLDINAAYANLEITGNFLLGEQLPADHYEHLCELLKDPQVRRCGKGAVYLSPLKDSPKKRELLPQFTAIKELSRLPVYIYLIQRL